MALEAGASPHAVPGTGGPAHFPCLDAYRGIGMLMVLLSHASFATGNTGSTLGPYLSRFELAVPMFFMLSGFLLYRPYALAACTGRPPTAPRRFLRRRALRIFPGYWAALVGVVVLFGAGTLDDAWAWLCNLVLLQQVGVDEPIRITQAWSIGVELSFYLLLPLYAAVVHRWASAAATGRAARPAGSAPDATAAPGGSIPGAGRRDPRRRLLAGCAALVAVGWLFRIGVVATAPAPGDPGFVGAWQAQTLNWLPMYLDFFAIGMALGVLSGGAASGLAVPAAVRWAGEHPAACWGVAGLVFVLVAQMDPPPTPFGLNGTEYLPRQAAYSFASAVWLAPAIFGDQDAGRFRAVLASRPLRWLGAISLSFYLWHLDLIHQAQRWTVDGFDDLTGLAVFAGDFWLVSAIAIVTTTAVAAVVHRLVEVPFLRLKDRPLRDLPAAYRDLRTADRPA